MNLRPLALATAVALIPAFSVAMSHTAQAQKSAALSEEITWDDLWPEGEDERIEEIYTTYMETLESGSIDGIAEGSDLDQMMQFGTFTTVEELDNTRVKIPGFVVPLDFNADSEYTEFLVVPYFGACLHTPPPPPNQIIFAKSEKPKKIEDIYVAYWFEGVLRSERNDTSLADAAYSLELSDMSEYRWKQ